MSKTIKNYGFPTHVINYHHWCKSKFINGVPCMIHNHEDSCRSSPNNALELNSKQRSHSINFVSSDYESLDYDHYESELTVREEKLNGYRTVVASNVIRWLIYFSIAICTAAVGIFIDTAIEYFYDWKYQSIRNCIDVKHSMIECLIIWLLFTVLPTIIGCSVVLFMEPSAAGSGIPFVISYLNGVRIPRMTAVRCLFVKVVSVVCVCIAGLGGGKVILFYILYYIRSLYDYLFVYFRFNF
uniref:H(+)/Cl(-) exchange transporter 7 n=1 Tax=Sipha flava TaxID=143950 RepID=A0A2S2PXL6_9HEMI